MSLAAVCENLSDSVRGNQHNEIRFSTCKDHNANG